MHRNIRLLILLSLCAIAVCARSDPALSPRPWKASWGKARLPLEKPCVIVPFDAGSTAAMEASSLLTEVMGGAARISSSARLPKSGTVVLLSTSRGREIANRLKALLSNIRWSEMGKEGYMLKAFRSGNTTVIAIIADSRNGAFYGAQTLRQLIERSQEKVYIPECTVIDRPAFCVRGIKGLWWNTDQYLEMAAWLPRHKFNFFMFCYTMFPETFTEWRKPFSSEQLAYMKRVVDLGRPRNLKVCLSINPSLAAKPSLIYSSRKDMNLLAAKLKSALGIGIRSFAICFDDIGLSLVNDEDKVRFKNLAEAQVSFMRALLKEMEAVNRNIEMIFCPTTYTSAAVSGAEAEEYINTIGKEMPEGIKIFWTGPVVCSPSVTDREADRFGAWIRRKPIIWDNYPVNDYCAHRLLMGPVKNRSPRLYRHVSGWISNPMMQSEASKIPLSTVADYLWNPQGYDPARSFDTALLRIAGKDAAPDVRIAAELYSDFLGEMPHLPQAADLSPDAAQEWAGRVERLRKRLSGRPQLSRLNSDLQPKLENILSSLKRRLLILKPKAWCQEGISFRGDELAGGAVDVYGVNYGGLSGCNWIYAVSTGYHQMSALFTLKDIPARALSLSIEGKDDDFPGKCRIKISLNGHMIMEGASDFPDAGWSSRSFEAPGEYLIQGENALLIETLEPSGPLGMPPWFMVRKVAMK